MNCIELGCTAEAAATGYCVPHAAQFWPLWAAHPLDEPCPPECPSKDRERLEGFYVPEYDGPAS